MLFRGSLTIPVSAAAQIGVQAGLRHDSARPDWYHPVPDRAPESLDQRQNRLRGQPRSRRREEPRAHARSAWRGNGLAGGADLLLPVRGVPSLDGG